MRSLALVVLLMCGAGCGAILGFDEPAVGGDGGADDDDGGGAAACVAPASPSTASVACRECLVGTELDAEASACTAAVCAIDAACCDAGWDGRCVALAAEACDLHCATAAAFGGYQSVTYVRWSGAAVTPGALLAGTDGYIGSLAWGDLDRDGDADLAIAADCAVRVYRNQGWLADQLQLDQVAAEVVPGCTRLGGHGLRARWYDVDRDGDVDVAYAAGDGAAWLRSTGAGFAEPAVIAPATGGAVSDLVLGDLDGDGAVDALVLVALAGEARDVQRYELVGSDFVRDPGWDGADLSNASVLALCDLTGDAGRELVMSGFNGLAAFAIDDGALGAPVIPAMSDPLPQLACGDVDGDGTDEIIGGGATSMVIDVVAGVPQVIWRSTDPEPDLALQPVGLAAGDVDGDGDVDVVAASRLDDAEDIQILTNGPAAAFDPAVARVPDVLAEEMLGAEVFALAPLPP